jgi:hypothetical protein
MGFGNGLLLAHLCKEEVRKWNVRFFIIALVTALLSIGIYFTKLPYKLPITMALLFMCITSLTIVFKGKLMHRYD